MSSPVDINCPCDGDAFDARRWPVERVSCDWCQRYHMTQPGAAMGACLGPEGWPFMALAGAEVARITKEGASSYTERHAKPLPRERRSGV